MGLRCLGPPNKVSVPPQLNSTDIVYLSWVKSWLPIHFIMVCCWPWWYYPVQLNTHRQREKELKEISVKKQPLGKRIITADSPWSTKFTEQFRYTVTEIAEVQDPNSDSEKKDYPCERVSTSYFNLALARILKESTKSHKGQDAVEAFSPA